MPQAPRAPRAPSLPRLELARYRTTGSRDLDGQTVKPRGEDAQPAPPYVRWPAFHRFMDEHWEAGEHLSVVAQTGSGKTTLIRELLDIRAFVVVLGTKREDDSLYGPLAKKGYRIQSEFDPRDIDNPRVVLRVPLEDASTEAENRQREQIRRVLREVYIHRGWTIVLDEVAYLAKDLKLDRELNALWREGRSAGTTVVAGTQRPVNVPRNMWEMATHTIMFRITGREDRATASEYLGDVQGVAFETASRLDRHEFLYVDAIESVALRSRVELGGR